MELTKLYMEQQETDHESYLFYRERKAKEFMEVISDNIGREMTHRELRNMEFGFKKGMDVVTQGGKFIAKEVLESERTR